MAQHVLPGEELNKLVMGYLREHGYYESLSSLALESNVGEGLMDEELLYLQKLTLQGRWNDTLRYLSPMRRILLHNFEMLEFMIKKQQYLESLSWLGAGGQKHALMAWKPSKRALRNADLDGSLNMQESSVILDEDDLDMDYLAVLLKEMEVQCTKEEFNHLCTLMTLENLTDDEKYANWSVSQGRLECFQSMRELLWKVLPGENSPDTYDVKATRNGGLSRVCSAALELQLRGQVGDVNMLSAELAALVAGGGASAGESGGVVPPSVVRGSLQGSDIAITEASYSAEPSKYNLSSDKGTVPVPVPVPVDEAAAEVSVDEAKVGTDTGTDIYPSAREVEVEEGVEIGGGSTGGSGSGSTGGSGSGGMAYGVGEADIASEAFSGFESPISSPSRGLKDIIRDDAHGIEIHVPRSNAAGILLSPHRDQQQHQQHQQHQRWLNPASPGAGSVGSHRSGIPMPARAGAGAGAGAGQKGVAWTLDLGEGEDPMVPVRVRPGGSSQLSSGPSSPSSHTSSASSASHQRNRKAKVQVKQGHHHSSGNSVASGGSSSGGRRKREGGYSTGTGTGAVAVQQQGPPPLPSSLGNAATDAPPPLPAQAQGQGHGYNHNRIYSDDRSYHSTGTGSGTLVTGNDNDSAATVTIDGRTLSTAGASTVIDDVSAGGAGVRAPQGGWPHQNPAPNTPTLAPPSGSHTHTGAPVGSATYAAHQHAKWAAFSSDSDSGRDSGRGRDGSGSALAISSSTLTKATCPLRCVKTVGLVADRGDATRKEIEILIGSNNKSISLIRTACSPVATEGGDFTTDAYGDVTGAGVAQTYIQREWVDAHRGSVYCLDYSSKTRLFASGSNDKTVRLGRVDSPLLSPPMKGHTGTVRVVAFGPSSSSSGGGGGGGKDAGATSGGGLHLVASGGGGDFKPRLWDVNTGSSHSVLTAHSACVHGVVWLDPVTLITGCEGGAIIAHDLRMSGAAWRFDLPAPVCTLASMENPLDAGSHYCVAGGTSGVVTIFNAKNGHIYASSRIHGDDVRSLALLPAPSIPQKGFSGISKMKSTPGLPLLFTTSYDGSSAMWRLRSNGFTRLGSSSKAGGSGSGSGSGGRSGVVTSGTNNHVFERLAVLQGEHSDKVLCGSVVPWTQQLITTGADGRVASWTI